MPDRWYLDPDETLEFAFDFAPAENGTGESNWLDRDSSPLEGIDTATVSSADSPGPTIISTSTNASRTVVTVKVSAANAMPGTGYPIECQIATTAGQTKTKTAQLFITQL